MAWIILINRNELLSIFRSLHNYTLSQCKECLLLKPSKTSPVIPTSKEPFEQPFGKYNYLSVVITWKNVSQ